MSHCGISPKQSIITLVWLHKCNLYIVSQYFVYMSFIVFCAGLYVLPPVEGSWFTSFHTSV